MVLWLWKDALILIKGFWKLELLGKRHEEDDDAIPSSLPATCSSDSLENHFMQMSETKPNSIKSLQLLLFCTVPFYHPLYGFHQGCPEHHSKHHRPPGIEMPLHF